MRKIQFVVSTLFLIGAAGASVILLNMNSKNMPSGKGSEPIACPMIAKLCPDGSSVGPTGPNCEFAACPGGSVPSSSPVPSSMAQ